MSDAESVHDLITYVAKQLVENPEAVGVHEKGNDSTRMFELTVDPDDRGRIIGKNGQTIHAFRAIVAAAATVAGLNATVDVRD